MDTRLLQGTPVDPTVRAILINRSMWQDPIAVHLAQEMVQNTTLMSRSSMIRRGDDPRRNIDKECGYPEIIEAEDYRRLYDREPIASRVVQVLPMECWQVTPEVYEDEDAKNITPFEKAWHDVAKALRGNSFFQDAEGNPIVEHWLRADILSGIGSYGIMLLGIDDGKLLSEPIEGFEDSPETQMGMGMGASGGDLDAQRGPVSLAPKGTQQKNLQGPNGEVGDTSQQQFQQERDNLRQQQQPRPSGQQPPSPDPRRKVIQLPEDPYEGDERKPNFNSLTNNEAPPQFRKRGAKQAVSQGWEYEDENGQADDEEGGQEFNGSGEVGDEPNPDEVSRQGDETEFPEEESGNPESDAMAGSGVEEETPDEAVDVNDMPPVATKYQLMYVRCFDETLVYVSRYESDRTNPRYGQPVMYNVTLNDPAYLKGGTGLSYNTVEVHWSRIIHVADNLGSSEVFGIPRMQPVYNRLLDLKKLHSGSAEMYWKGAFSGYNLVTHPQLGGDVSFDIDDIKSQMEQYFNGLQRYTAIAGASMNSLAPQVVDPTTQITVQLEAICVRLGVPMRVFMGSERGELASSQDAGTWNDRLKQRQNNYLTPRLIVPFVDRLIHIGVLPEPKGYSVFWPDLSAASDLEKAQKANMLTQALGTYVSAQIENIMTLKDYLTRIWGWDEEEAAQVEESTRLQNQMVDGEMFTMDPEMDQQMLEAQMQQMTDPELVPDNINTGDQHHYQPGSMDKQAELEHERIIADKEEAKANGQQIPGQPPGKPGEGPPGKAGKPGAAAPPNLAAGGGQKPGAGKPKPKMGGKGPKGKGRF